MHRGYVVRLLFGCAIVAVLGLAGVLVSGGPSSSRLSNVTVSVSGLTVEAAGATGVSPKVSAAEASSIALRALSDPRFTNPKPVGLHLQSQDFQAGVTSIRDRAGDLIFATRPAMNVWILQFTALPQPHFSKIVGSVIINSDTGSVVDSGLISEP